MLLRPERAQTRREGDSTGWIGNTGDCFMRQQTCGLCGQNNLKQNYLRRGRLPSGCIHSLQTCPANGSMSLVGPAFSSKYLRCRNPATMRLEERDSTLPGIYSLTGVVNSIALKLRQRESSINFQGQFIPRSIHPKVNSNDQFTNLRIRTFITMPSARNVNSTEDPP